MRTLFIGATGFIGRELAKLLVKDMDLTFLYSSPESKLELNHPYMVVDLSEASASERILERKFDRVIDASWFGLPDLTPPNNNKNLTIKQRLIDTMVRMESSEYIGFGSCLEYGSVVGSVKETCLGVNVGDFGQVKRSILNLIDVSGLRYKWFRPFYLIGPNQHQNSLLNSAIRSIENGADFSPRDPSASYDFISLKHALPIIHSIIESDKSDGIFNVGSGETRSVNQLVNLVRASYGRPTFEITASEGMYANLEKIQTQMKLDASESVEETVENVITEIRSR
jgi:nucleoside-diphosphate-sugar epimerase